MNTINFLSMGTVYKPYSKKDKRGLFATRSPRRPNPIGVFLVFLEKIENITLYISDIDVIDGTPLIDIKPYVPSLEI